MSGFFLFSSIGENKIGRGKPRPYILFVFISADSWTKNNCQFTD